MRSHLRNCLVSSAIVATTLISIDVISAPSYAATECQANSKLSTILKRGKLLAGIKYDYPPFGYVDKDGKVVGFGADLAQEFGKHMGVTVEFIQTRAQTRIPLLLNGTIDLDFGPTTPLKSRDEAADFSYPIVWDRTIFLVKEGKSPDPKDYYTDTSKVIGMVQGSAAQGAWKELSPSANMKLFQEYPDAAMALLQDKIDVLGVAEYTARQIVANMGARGKALVIGRSYFQDPQSIMVSENDSKFRDWVNWAIQRLWGEGTFQQLYKKHYLTEPTFDIWHNGQLQPRVKDIGKECDPW